MDMNRLAMTPERQAQIRQMAAYDREQKRLEQYNPEYQKANELRMISEYFRHNYKYVQKKMIEKFKNMSKYSKFFTHDVIEEEKNVRKPRSKADLGKGEMFKTLLVEGKSYNSPSMNDLIKVKCSIRIVKGKYPKDPVVVREQERKEEEEEEDRVFEELNDDAEPGEQKRVEISEANADKHGEEHLLFVGNDIELEYHLYNESTFFGLDVVLENTNLDETSETLMYGVYLTNLFPFLNSKFQSKSKELKELEPLFAKEAAENENEAENGSSREGGLMVKVKLHLVQIHRVLDIFNDGGVFKEVVKKADSSEGLSWPSEFDHVISSVQVVKGSLNDEIIDYGDLNLVWKHPDFNILKKLPFGVLKAMQEVKRTEISNIRVMPTSQTDEADGGNRYDKYASREFRRLNGLKEDSELVYKVETKSVQKVYKALDKKVFYRVLDKGFDNEIKSPRTLQRISFKLRWFINEYEQKTMKTAVVDKEVKQRKLLKRHFICGMGCKDEEQEPELKPTDDYSTLSMAQLTTGLLPVFIEKVAKKLNRDKHVIISFDLTTQELFMDHPEFNLLLENMFLNDQQGKENLNINSGEIHALLLEMIANELTESEQKAKLKEYFTQIFTPSVSNDATSSAGIDNEEASRWKVEEVGKSERIYEMEVDFILSHFESKDTYWDFDELQRRNLILEYKSFGNMFFKNECYHQAIDCYLQGCRVYSNHNFTMIDSDKEKTIVKPLKISCFLNLATSYSKMKESDKMYKILKDLDDFIKKDEGREKDDKEKEREKAMNLKIMLKKGLLELELNNTDVAKKWFMKVKEKNNEFPGLRDSLLKYKATVERLKENSKKTFKGFLQQDKKKDILATDESRKEKEKKKPDSLNFAGIDPKDWEKKAREFYGIE